MVGATVWKSEVEDGVIWGINGSVLSQKLKTLIMIGLYLDIGVC